MAKYSGGPNLRAASARGTVDDGQGDDADRACDKGANRRNSQSRPSAAVLGHFIALDTSYHLKPPRRGTLTRIEVVEPPYMEP